MPEPVDPLPTTILYTNDGRPFRALVTQGQRAIPYIELLSFNERFHRDGVDSTRYCACAWEDREDFVLDMVGTNLWVAGNVVGGVVTNLQRYPPEQHPLYPELYCDGCDLDAGQGVPTSNRDDLAKALTSIPDYGNLEQYDDNNAVSFNLAFYKVTYSPRDYQILGDEDVPDNGFGELNRNISIYFKPAAENLPYPGGAFKFQSDGTLINEPPAKTFPTTEFQLVWHDIPYPPVDAWQTIIGACNLNPFTLLFSETLQGQYPAQTLICMPPEMQPHRSAAREFLYDITYVMVFRAKTWNALFRRIVPAGGGPDPPGSPGFDRIIGQDGVTYATPLQDFAGLFVLPMS